MSKQKAKVETETKVVFEQMHIRLSLTTSHSRHHKGFGRLIMSHGPDVPLGINREHYIAGLAVRAMEKGLREEGYTGRIQVEEVK